MKKYKLKTHNGAKRRFKITGSGLILRTNGGNGGGKSHFRRRKSQRTKQAFDKMSLLSPTHVQNIRRTLPYGIPGK